MRLYKITPDLLHAIQPEIQRVASEQNINPACLQSALLHYLGFLQEFSLDQISELLENPRHLLEDYHILQEMAYLESWDNYLDTIGQMVKRRFACPEPVMEFIQKEYPVKLSFVDIKRLLDLIQKNQGQPLHTMTVTNENPVLDHCKHRVIGGKLVWLQSEKRQQDAITGGWYLTTINPGLSSPGKLTFADMNL